MQIEQVQAAIESHLDAKGGFDSLDNVYATIADLCREKAEHIRTNWQDEGLAHLWERYAGACDKAREAYDKAAARID